MDLRGKKIVIFVDNLYQEMEVWYPYFRFQEAGAAVLLAAAEAGATYTSKLGYPATPDVRYEQLSAREFDGVVVPGGYAPDRIRRNTKANQFVREMDAAGKLVAAICHGPWVLCSAEMLKGRRATSLHRNQRRCRARGRALGRRRGRGGRQSRHLAQARGPSGVLPGMFAGACGEPRPGVSGAKGAAISVHGPIKSYGGGPFRWHKELGDWIGLVPRPGWDKPSSCVRNRSRPESCAGAGTADCSSS